MKPIAPRLHAILAREARLAVVFRRGPARQVCTMLWNLQTDQFTLGQWLKGRIFVWRADLSPDGAHIVYAADGYRGSLDGWTAISRAPYLTALQVCCWGDLWTGGGAFLDNRRCWVNRWRPGRRSVRRHATSKVVLDTMGPEGFPPDSGPPEQFYLARLQRDGWTLAPGDFSVRDARFILEKVGRSGLRLQKAIYTHPNNGPLGASQQESHRVIGPESVMDCPAWEWAEFDGDSIVYAENGQMWRSHFHGLSLDTPIMLHDFNGMQFEAVAAPYAGLRRQ